MSAADLADRDAVMCLVDGVDAIVHLGGISIDAQFDGLFPTRAPTDERDHPAQASQGGAFVLGEPMEKKR